VLLADPVAVRQVLSDGDHFAKSGPGSSGALWTPVLGDRVLLNMDGADHRDLRRRLADLFSPRAVESVCRASAQPLVDAARERLLAGDEVDVADLARQVSAAAICTVVGLRPTEAARTALLDASDAIESLVTWRTRTLTGRQAANARAHLEPVMAAAARARAEGDRSTVMGRMHSAGVGEQEARSLAAALFLTGVGTVSSAQPRILGQLADAGLLVPGALDPERDLDTVVGEGLRMTTPSPATLRRFTADLVGGGTRLRAGDRAVLLLWWATRLEGGFDHTRPVPSDLRHLWFGAGSHFCLGAPLALAELRAMTAMLLEVAADRGLVVRSRRAARRVLVPRYAELRVAAARDGG
jgi:cytochrome P450